jgi:hypothetical protein
MRISPHPERVGGFFCAIRRWVLVWLGKLWSFEAREKA